MAVTIPNGLTAVLNKIPDLDKTNWAKWSKGMTMFFLGVGAEFIATGTAPDAGEIVKASLDKQMLPYIYGKVSEEYQYLVEDGTSATAVWKELKGQFEKSSMSNRITARQELYGIEHDPSRDIAVYFHDITAAVARLKALGVTVPDQEQKDVILMHLHSSFHTARGVILTTATEPDLTSVKDLLKTTAASDPSVTVKSESAVFGMAARQTRPSSSVSSQGSIGTHGFPVDEQGNRWCDPTNSNCHRCGRPGHIAAKCMYSMPQFVKDWILKHANSPNPSSAFAAAVAAGLTPEMFSEHYKRHVGTSSNVHAKSAHVAHSANAARLSEISEDEYSSDSDESCELDASFDRDDYVAPVTAASVRTSYHSSGKIILHS